MRSSNLFFVIFLTSLSHANIPLYLHDPKKGKSDHACLFAHGLWIDHKHAHKYSTRKEWGMFDHPIVSFNFPEIEREFNRKHVSIGQQPDVDQLSRAHSTMKQLHQDYKKIILCGVSRGASAVINYLGTTKNKLDDIAIVILESPFDRLDTILKQVINRYRIHWIPKVHNIARGVVKKLYAKYRHTGVQPINVIKNIPADIPIILAHSKKDWFIPIDATRRLYLELLDAGHKNVYLIETEHGGHAKMLWKESGTLYRNTVHAIFKRHAIPYNPQWAKYGHKHLEKFQPTWLEVYRRISKR